MFGGKCHIKGLKWEELKQSKLVSLSQVKIKMLFKVLAGDYDFKKKLADDEYANIQMPFKELVHELTHLFCGTQSILNSI